MPRPSRCSARPGRPLVEALESRILFDGIAHYLALGAINGGTVTLLDSFNNSVIRTFHPYGNNYRSGVSVAVGDVDGDGTPEVITAPTTPGAVPLVEVFSLAGTRIASFMAFDPSFKGGIMVASADFTEDGHDDIAVAAGAGGGPHVKVFNYDTLLPVRSFFAFSQSFRGGVNIATGDVNNDGVADIIATPKIGGGPVVRVINGANGVEVLHSYTFQQTSFAGGIRVTTGDVNGDGYADVIAGTGFGTAATVTIISGIDSTILDTFSPFSTTQGFSIATLDQDLDGQADVVVAQGRVTGRQIAIYKGTDHSQLIQLNATGIDLQAYNLASFVGALRPI